MRKIVVLLVCVLSFGFANAQKPDRFELGVFHPVAIGDNFLEQSYEGFVGVDVKYVYAKPGIFRCKVGADVSWIKEDGSLAAVDNIYKVNPKLVFGVGIPVIKLEPYVNLGYGLYFLSGDGGQVVAQEEDLLDGFNAGIGINWTIGKWFYIDANYQFSKLNQDELNSSFYENIEFINVGVGIKI